MRQPRDAALDGDELERGELLEDALAHERVDGRHVIDRENIVPLHVARGPAGRRDVGRGAGAFAAGVDRDRQAHLGGRLVDRMEKPLAKEPVGPAGHEHLGDLRVRAPFADLAGGGDRIAVIDDDRAAKARGEIEPRHDKPFVERGGERGAVVGVVVQRKRKHARAGEHGVVDAVAVHVVLHQERGTAARTAGVVVGPGIFPEHADGRGVAGVGNSHAAGLHLLAPATGEKRQQVVGRSEGVVDIGVDELERGRDGIHGGTRLLGEPSFVVGRT